MIRKERLSKLLKLAQQLLSNIQEDWDIEKEEKNIEEEAAWEEFKKQKEEIDKDKIERAKRKLPGWEANQKGRLGVFSWLSGYSSENKWVIFDPDFIEDNSETLTKFTTRHGHTEPKYLGSGAFGTAFLLGDGKVLKISASTHLPGTGDKMKDFLDYYDFSSKMLFDKMFGAETELAIFEKGSLSLRGKPVLGWAIMEKVEREMKNINSAATITYYLSHSITKKLGYIDKFEMSAFPELTTKNLHKNLTEEKIKQLKEVSSFAVKENLKNENDFRAEVEIINRSDDVADDWLEHLALQVAIKLLSGRRDFHAGNLGLRPSTGHFIFFDA